MNDIEKIKNEDRWMQIQARLNTAKAVLDGCFPYFAKLSAGLVLFITLSLGGIFVVASITTSVSEAVTGLTNATGSFLGSLGQLLGGVSKPRIYILPRVQALETLSSLTTVRFNYSRIVTGAADMPAMLGGLYGNNLVMIAVGHIEAGVDLSQITESDLFYNQVTHTILITLPAPTLQRCFLNEQQTQVVERNSGIFAAEQPQLDNETRRYALRQFRDFALQGLGNEGEEIDGILEQAKIETEKVVQNFVLALNMNQADTVPNVQVVFDEPLETVTLPETCR